MVFDFNKLKRETFDMIMPGDSEVSLHLLRPIKSQINTISSAVNAIDEMVASQQVTNEQLDLLTTVTAEMLSRNLENKHYTKDNILDKFDVDEMIYFIDNYLSFVLSFTTEKN